MFITVFQLLGHTGTLIPKHKETLTLKV
jgi:hypothetical protein